jgi:hypothetical protein
MTRMEKGCVSGKIFLWYTQTALSSDTLPNLANGDTTCCEPLPQGGQEQ